MSGRSAARVGWGFAALSAGLMSTGAGLSLAGPGIEVSAARGLTFAVVIVFSVLGALIAARHPRNPIGWIFCGIAVAGGFLVLSRDYTEYWLDGHAGSATLGETAAWYAAVSWVPVVLPAATFVLLLFPDGRLLSRRWRPVAWCAAVGIALVFVGDSLAPGPLEDNPQLANPYGSTSPVRVVLSAIGVLLVLIAIVGSPLSLVLRFRRAGREQRQQIKWIALAGAVAAATFVVAVVVYDLLTAAVADAAILGSVLCLPLAAGVAILRHQLYDIDVVINRTLVYGALTATLGAAYLASVLLLQLALSPLTSDSGLAVAGSTLAVAALFRPARARIQAVVDRRFYRRRYDAQRTLEAFSSRLRDQVDLGTLNSELCAMVQYTLEPAHVSLWLRGRDTP